eukprot:TRINITY_DN32567_c0_g1_i1.p1 TRINITY_DN32567_c0_g1~~TRINITY_DN32567_c0_g1_i1.p1  ORF type:complete len:847 (+),score=217.47 TRINITY_DN32567_c0_g1_i1:168-2543(+)
MEDVPASEFDARDFDGRELVQRYRKRLPLPQLQKSLRAHYAATRQELVELINEKYADFVSLSSRMQGVERALKPLRAPLEESAELTKSLQSRLGGILDQAEDAHKELGRIQARKEALAEYIKNAKLLDKAKAAAEQRWANPQESDDMMREHTAQENIARDLRRIRLNLGTGGRKEATDGEKAEEDPMPERVTLLAEAAAFEEVFAKGLQDRLRVLVGVYKRAREAVNASSDPSASTNFMPRTELLAISHLCRALVTLGRPQAVEAVFTEVFVAAALEAASARCAAAAEEAHRSGAEGGNAGGVLIGAVDLGAYFDAIRASLLAESSGVPGQAVTAPLLWLARRLRGGAASADGAAVDVDDTLMAVPSLHLVANAAAIPVLKHVQTVWPNVFMPAFPDVFATNHAHAMKFLHDAQALMAPAELKAFAQSTALADFRKRWKTQVYASLRSKEGSQRLDAASSSSQAAVKSDAASARHHGGGKFWLEVSAELVQLLHLVWGDRWYLETLYPKMAQLSVELLARYGKTVRIIGESTSSDALQLTGAWDATGGNWLPASLPAKLSRAAADVSLVLEAIACTRSTAEGEAARIVVARAPGGPHSKPAELILALFLEAAKELRPVLERLGDAVLKQVSAVVVPQFAAIRGIPAFYRMLNKPLPSKASPYVESALRPIQALKEEATKAAPEAATAGWVQKAIEAAAVEFASQAAQLLDSTRQQEASLRRLVAARSGAGGDAQISDLDKIHVQLCLDVETFTKAAEALGCTAGNTEGLSKLTASVETVWPTYRQHCPEAK